MFRPLKTNSRSRKAKIGVGFLVCLSFAGAVSADQLVENKDGSFILRKSDGTKVVTNADGSSVD